MPIAEPTTLASDWALAAVAAALGTRLLRAGRSEGRPATLLWAAAFLAGGAAALAGGAVHGFAAALPPAARAALWKTVLAGGGLAGSLLLAGIAVATLRGGWRRIALAAAAGELALYLAVVTVSDDVRHAVGNAAATILAVLALALASARRDPRRLGWMLLGLGLAAAGLAAQRGPVSLGALNHNDVCHVLQMMSLWPLYRAERRRRGDPT